MDPSFLQRHGGSYGHGAAPSDHHREGWIMPSPLRTSMGVFFATKSHFLCHGPKLSVSLSQTQSLLFTHGEYDWQSNRLLYFSLIGTLDWLWRKLELSRYQWQIVEWKRLLESEGDRKVSGLEVSPRAASLDFNLVFSSHICFHPRLLFPHHPQVIRGLVGSPKFWALVWQV